MAVARYLVDTSAFARAHLGPVDAVLAPLLERRLVAMSGMVALELGYATRSPRDYSRLDALVESLEWLEMDDRAVLRAREVQGLLAAQSRVRQVGIADLLVAATAERHRVALLHYDADFEAVADLTRQQVQWVVPRGSVP